MASQEDMEGLRARLVAFETQITSKFQELDNQSGLLTTKVDTALNEHKVAIVLSNQEIQKTKDDLNQSHQENTTRFDDLFGKTSALYDKTVITFDEVRLNDIPVLKSRIDELEKMIHQIQCKLPIGGDGQGQ